MNIMYPTKSFTKIKFLFIVLSVKGIKCTIDGSFPKPRVNDTKTGDDPCNPPYWYPRNIPEYCNFRKMSSPTPPGPDLPIPIPIPVPLPPPMPIPMPIPPPPVVPPLMMPPHIVPPGPPPPIMVPQPIMPLPMPLPFGIPLAPTNPMVPVAGIPLQPQIAVPAPPPYPMPYPPPYPQPYSPPYPSPLPASFPAPFPAPLPAPFPAPYPPPYQPAYPSPYPMPPRRGIGMVPGIPGLVSPDGGINIMPFSDAYSDMLENHKQKMIRRRLQKLLNEYEVYPWKSHRKSRRHNGKEDNEEKLDENIID